MVQAVSLILVTIFTFGSVFSNPAKFLAPTVIIHIEHSHKISSVHSHHHDDIKNDLGHSDHEGDRDHDRQSEHKEPVPHSHNVSISMSNGYVIGNPSIETILIIDQLKPVCFVICNDRAPENRVLSSIFRPPIA